MKRLRLLLSLLSLVAWCPLAAQPSRPAEGEATAPGGTAPGGDEPSERAFAFGVRPEGWYNRVDALHVGAGVTVRRGGRMGLGAKAGYSTGLAGRERWSYEGRARWAPGASGALFAEVRYGAGTVTAYESRLYGPLLNAAAVLLGGEDYFDYFRNEGGALTLGYAPENSALRLSLSYRHEHHRSLGLQTSYDLFGEDEPLRPNPPVDEGRLRSLVASLVLVETAGLAGLLERERAAAAIEYSPPSLAGGTFDFVRVDFFADARARTFYRAEKRPNTLSVRLAGSASAGTLPVQRFGIVEGRLGLYSPFGGLHTLGGRPYAGEHALALFWEHDFGTRLFERSGLRALARRRYGLVLFGGHGKAWISKTRRETLPYVPFVPSGIHHEAGLALTGVFRFLRLDVTARLDAPGFGFGVSTAGF